MRLSEILEGLTVREKNEIDRYSGDFFLKLNAELRQGIVSDPAVKHLDSAISKSKLSGQPLYRGITREAARALFDGHITIGQEVSDQAFVSTSKNRNVATMNSGWDGIVMEIIPTENATGLDMSRLSRNGHEDECLLPRNAKMTVTRIRQPKNRSEPTVVRLTLG